MKDLYAEIYKMLMKEFEEDTNKWKDILCPQIRKINIVKIFILSKAIYKFNACQNSNGIFHRNRITILKLVWNYKKKPYHQRNPEEEGITRPDFKLYCKAIVIKTVWYWYKNRYIDKWNRIESPEISSHIYSQLIFHKGAKNTQWGKDSLLPILFQTIVTELQFSLVSAER